MFDLQGKRALVTGASGGIGRHIAKSLHDQGAHVALNGRKAEALQETASLLDSDLARVKIVQGDIGSVESVDSVIKTTIEKLGGIDILINNAGLTRDNLAMRMKDEEWQQVLDVNLTAAFRLTRSVLRPMMKARWGRVINISSIVGTTGNPGQANYAASKAGLMGMTKSLAAEVANRGITVNCIAPGFIETAMTDALSDDQKSKLNANIPAARLGQPEDISAGVVYLASDEASYITGQTLHINGGMAMI